MNRRVLAAAVAVVMAVSLPGGVAAKGSGGGHSGGGHSGGHAGGGHAGGGHSTSARSNGGQARSGGGGARTSGGGTSGGGTTGGSARGGASQPAPAGTVHGGGRTTTGGAAPVGVSQPRGSRSPDGHLVVGTAVPRSAHAQIVVPVAPAIFVPQIFRPHFVGFGFGYGVRRLGLGYSAAYYGLAYDQPLLCEEMVDCYAAPAPGAVDAAPYDAPPPSPDDAATIVLQVQPASAQVFVDGAFVGTVDDLQSALTVAPGVHRVEFRASGYDPIVVDVRVAPGGRITYRAALKPSA